MQYKFRHFRHLKLPTEMPFEQAQSIYVRRFLTLFVVIAANFIVLGLVAIFSTLFNLSSNATFFVVGISVVAIVFLLFFVLGDP